MQKDGYLLNAIGYVRNNISNRSDMTAYGVRSVIEMLPEYIQAIEGIEESSHIILSCFFHHAKRDVLRVHPRKFNVYSITERGVFATRSPDRPNPVSFTVVKLLKAVDNRKLEVEGLDLIDGTPVIDIKPYTEMDVIFNMNKSSKTISFSLTDEKVLSEYLLKNASNYIFENDGSLETAVSFFVKIIKSVGMFPDRESVICIETDFEGSALDCIYYYSKITPGENRIHLKSPFGQNNTYIKIFLKTGEIIEAKAENLHSIILNTGSKKS